VVAAARRHRARRASLAFGVWRWSRARGPDEEPEQLDPDTEQRLDELLARLD
jgi:hypothetical protein